MAGLKVIILLGVVALVMANHCEAAQKTQTVHMTPEMKKEYEKFLQMRKDSSEGPNSREVPAGSGSTNSPESQDGAHSKKFTISMAFQAASHNAARVAKSAAKVAAKGATSALKNLKGAQPKHSTDDHVPMSNRQAPPPEPAPQPRAQHHQPPPSFFQVSGNFDLSTILGNQKPTIPVYKPPHQSKSKDDEQKPPTKAEAKEARDSLFYRSRPLTRNEVLTYIDTLRRWPEYEQMKGLGRVPIDLDLLTRISQTSEANCEDKAFMKSMANMEKKLYYQEDNHGKALVPFLKETLAEQLKLCDYAQKSMGEFLEFATEDPQRWELVLLWNNKVGHFGKRHTKWGEEDQYLNNGIQLNEALTEMIDERLELRTPQDKYDFGYKLILALQGFCKQMDRLGGTLSMTRLEKNYKKNETIKEFHKLMSVCEQTKNSNYLQSLGGALWGMHTTYSGYTDW